MCNKLLHWGFNWRMHKISTKSMRPICDVTRLQTVQAKPHRKTEIFPLSIVHQRNQNGAESEVFHAASWTPVQTSQEREHPHECKSTHERRRSKELDSNCRTSCCGHSKCRTEEVEEGHAHERVGATCSTNPHLASVGTPHLLKI